MYIRTEDGSVFNPVGNVLYFSINRFVSDICYGDCCFICGASPSKVKFNKEHILPDWILSKYNLYGKSITLPNSTDIRYDRYTVPACEQCNSLMGRTFEDPISDLISQGYNAVSNYLKSNGPWLFFQWLALIFLKTHLKDTNLRLHRDRRKGDEKISDFYTWEELHHIHCIARSFYTHCELKPSAFGSLLVLPAKTKSYYEHFDYSDLYSSKTMLLRLNDIAFITVLNDSCAAWNVCRGIWEKITGFLSPVQLRELMAHFAFVNLHLKERPVFHSEFNAQENVFRVSANLPSELVLEEHKESEFGMILYWCCRDIIDGLPTQDKNRITDHVKHGKWSFLFNKEGNFLTNSMELI